MSQPGPRILREQRTIRAMVDIYCRDHHPPDGWHRCTECDEFLDYASRRLHNCPFQEEKPVCRECSIHCYKTDLRLKAREIMRHSGPRMILYHPISAIRHLILERMAPPEPAAPRKGRMSEECLNVPFPPIC